MQVPVMEHCYKVVLHLYGTATHEKSQNKVSSNSLRKFYRYFTTKLQRWSKHFAAPTKFQYTATNERIWADDKLQR